MLATTRDHTEHLGQSQQSGGLLHLQPFPDFGQGLGQLDHHRFAVGGAGGEAQALKPARHGREIDRLDIDAVFGEQDVADLLGADRIGVSLSDEWQLHPEQSTSAIVVLNPRAKYFSV